MSPSRLASPEFTITIGRDGALVAWNEADRDELKDKITFDELALEMIKFFRGWLSKPFEVEPGKTRDRITETDELALLGKLLFRQLFKTSRNDLWPFFQEKLEKTKGQRLRLQLRFDEEAADLATLPWEFLYDPFRKEFLVTRVDLVLSRYIQYGAREPLNADPAPLRILLVVSKPADLPTVAEKDIVDALNEFKAKESGRIEFEALENPDMQTLKLKLEEADRQGNFPHVLHWIGHGRYSTSKRKGEIAFVDTAYRNRAKWIEDAQFVLPFQLVGRAPRLMILQLCEGAVVEQEEFLSSFAGLAPRLISSNVQAVVAMQFPIRNRDAKSFSREFYAALARGQSVDEAVQTARTMLFSSAPIACGTPVLYLRSYDGIILPPGETAGRGAEAAAASAGVGTGTAAARQPASVESTGGAAVGPGPSRSAGAAVPALNLVLEAGQKKIQAIPLDKHRRMSLRSRLYNDIKNDLSGKTVAEMNEKLVERWANEADPDFKEVILEMAETAGNL